MRALVQRVCRASVEVDGQQIGAIGTGLLVLLGVTHTDGQADLDYLTGKVSKLRIFSDEAGKMNRSVSDIGGSILVVPQFTLYGDTRRGNRPGFDQAAQPDQANLLYEQFCTALIKLGIPVSTGQFAADMKVSLINDGPVTLMIDSAERNRTR